MPGWVKKPRLRQSSVASAQWMTKHPRSRKLHGVWIPALRSGRTILHQPRPVGFQVSYHAVDPAHLGSSHLAQIP
jgi:hypothetical protein